MGDGVATWEVVSRPIIKFIGFWLKGIRTLLFLYLKFYPMEDSIPEITTTDHQKKTIAIISIILVLWGLFGVYYYNLSHKTHDAHSECKEAMLAQLKSPWSAKFSPLKEDHTLLLELKWYVDSQNSYGALLRTNFICSVWNDWDVSTFTSDDLDPSTYNAKNSLFDDNISNAEKQRIIHENYQRTLGKIWKYVEDRE